MHDLIMTMLLCFQVIIMISNCSLLVINFLLGLLVQYVKCRCNNANRCFFMCPNDEIEVENFVKFCIHMSVIAPVAFGI